MTIKFTELNRTGQIVLGTYETDNRVLAYECRSPTEDGKTDIFRNQSLETVAKVYWQKVADLSL